MAWANLWSNDGEDAWSSFSWPYRHAFRFLAEKRLYIDYSVLSVGVMTLGLIMVVEVLRHKMDHAAEQRPFFKAVLEGVYSELATLGIVEFFLYVLSTYYENLDKDKYYVFADVHFALFYTAILNAFQSVILAIASSRVVQRSWVQTEMLELSHYVEIREEFERVKKQMSLDTQTQKLTTTTRLSDPENSNAAEEANSAFALPEEGLLHFWKSLVYRIRYPSLRLKYNDLLLQIRFHELRVHFLQAYQLPLKLKVSDYLLRSEQQVLLKLVHVSSVAWLLLTGAVNVLYYLVGVVSYKLDDSTFVAQALIYVFFLSMLVFVVVAIMVYYKMTAIFRKIMLEKTLWDVNDNVNDNSAECKERRERLAEQQLALFWGGDPILVIAAIQFMQFGYAVMLSVIIIYWDDIDDGDIPTFYYPLVLAICYSFFIMVTAQVIPRYTLCTRLGQLVDKEQLHQCLAAFQLAEAQRENTEKLLLENGFDKSLLATQARRIAHSSAGNTLRDASSVGSAGSFHGDQAASLMAELVKLDTDSLRETLPADERNRLAMRQMQRANRRNRRKTQSEGVAAMAAMGSGSSTPFGALGLASLTRRSGGQTVTRDDTFLSHSRMRDDTFLTSTHARNTETNSSILAPIPSTGIKPSKSSEKLKPEDTEVETLRARRRRRHHRQKSVSDGVAAMALMHEANAFALNVPEPVLETHIEDHTDDHPLEDDIIATNSPKVVVELPPSLNVQHSEERTTSSVFKSGASSMSLTSGDDIFGLGKQITASKQDMDNASMQSNASDGGLSDDDDVPDAAPITVAHDAVIAFPKRRLKDRIRKYFLTKKYVLLSNVFGTMVAFYMVGQRVERFLHTEGVVSERPVTFEFDNVPTFWMVMVLLSAFLCIDVLILHLFAPWTRPSQPRVEKKVFVAAMMDFALVSVCFGLFIAAEVSRCCSDDRRLAEDPEYGYGEVESYKVYLDPPVCGCPTFGSRLYGGLGTLEPWTSLFCLRIFRHFVAKRLVSYIERRKDADESNAGMNLRPFSVFDTSEHAAGKDGHGLNGNEMKGTAAELWEATVSKNPDLVEKHGEFSSEILKAMLGIRENEPQEVKSQTSILPEELKPKAILPSPSTQTFALGKEYSSLSLDAQGCILAGKLGRSVSVCNFEQAGRDPGSIPENEDAPHAESGALLFRLDQEASETVLPGQEAFASPNAPLVRNMRRCDRKLLPILDKWNTVDVVMTKYEIVYFDATEEEDFSDNPQLDGVREALSATKGGKGVRLRDVARGRRVVGRLGLSEIENVTVEREMPVEGSGAAVDDGPDNEVSKTEWWRHDEAQETRQGNRAEKWCKIKEDRLRIHTVQGRTLYLRFYSDLEDAENHVDRLAKEDELNGDIFKNNAFQWAQTIARFLGPDHLKQALPHFGESDADELRDYLVVHHHHIAESEHRMGFHRRTASTGELASLALGGISRQKTKQNLVRRQSSLHDRSQEDDTPKKSRRHGRVQSMDTSFSLKHIPKPSLGNRRKTVDSSLPSKNLTSNVDEEGRAKSTGTKGSVTPDIGEAASDPEQDHGKNSEEENGLS